MLRRFLSPFLPFRRKTFRRAGRRTRWRGCRSSQFKVRGGECSQSASARELQQLNGDVEAPQMRRRFAPEASHKMALSSGTENYTSEEETISFAGTPDAATFPSNLFLWALSEDAREDVKEQQKQAAIEIVKASSSHDLFDKMDKLIDEQWPAGKDGFPGNIYYVLSLSLGRGLWDDGGIIDTARRVGFVAIILVQLVGPPTIAWQYMTGHCMEDADQMHWSVMNESFPSVADWQAWKGFSMTKLLSAFFVVTFCLNTLFCWMDEGVSWVKVYRIYQVVNLNSPDQHMEGTSAAILMMSCFVNSWVAIWCCIDIYLCLGSAKTAQDVLMDAFSLSFLYNLDDIGGVLGFVDGDDWPSSQLAWLHDAFDHFDLAEEAHIQDFDAENACCACYIRFVTYLLVIMALALPAVFIATPFTLLLQDPWYEEKLTKEDWAAFVLNVTATARAANTLMRI